jgi:hypothetical protein
MPIRNELPSLAKTPASHFSRRRIIQSVIGLGALAFSPGLRAAPFTITARQLLRLERKRILRRASQLSREPVSTVTDFPASRSPGNRDAYYSEGDYWWPDPANPGGPYIRRDGQSNPGRFEAHRLALIRMSRIVPWLASAHRLTRQARYLAAMQGHLDGWFVAPATRMAPHLNHAQAIIGVNTGRGTGIIDTLHLVEVARACLYVDRLGKLKNAAAIKGWFKDYLDWMLTSPNGIDEGDEVNNHGTTYMLQVAVFAELVEDKSRILWTGEKLRNLIAKQIEPDGRQPLELARTKPFGYALFNLDALAMLAHVLSVHGDDVWAYETKDGRSIAKAVRWLEPFIRNKAKWPMKPDVEYFDQWPMRHASLLLAASAMNDASLYQLWTSLRADSEVPEVIRNTPIRQPLLWF